ncbi:hypothetical protein CYMTET_4545 [Cymbomonas tetramitiformis]|uniref:ATP-dependent DNA helicase n=1 Tax=Cymbomonas tetramitiformis TaxID=36881 RepID=A0AAE0H2T8_9CHLO|nr:hypothetical protein CYMTET_47225 [Cymbomonas tetramitiformis]KAK3287991.1 hypothetical protein CYMTET_4545 [Cymbomonas tetramitiformis]
MAEKRLKVEDLNLAQQEALCVLVSEDRNLIVLGEAGTGKSEIIRMGARLYTLNVERQGRRDVGCKITAPYGMAASKLEGDTVDTLFPELVGLTCTKTCEKILRARLKQSPDLERWRVIRCLCLLVIDEASTLTATKLRVLDAAFRVIRGSDTSFMGGVRVMLCGDFLQLDPVENDEKLYLHQVMREGEFKLVTLTENMRQSEDRFRNLLGRVRIASPTAEDVELLTSLSGSRPSESLASSDVLQICGTKLFAKEMNSARYRQLVEREHAFHAVVRWKDGEGDEWATAKVRDAGSVAVKSDWLKAQLRDLRKEECVRSTADCALKIGSRVMLNRNLYAYADRMMRNGRVGTVVSLNHPADDFDTATEAVLSATAFAEVRFDDAPDRPIRIAPALLRRAKGQLVAEVWCMPLTLAWAVTVYKSQGCEVDQVVVRCDDLSSPKQVYVALSRCRNLDGVALVGFDASSICPLSPEDAEFHRFLDRHERRWDYKTGLPKARSEPSAREMAAGEPSGTNRENRSERSRKRKKGSERNDAKKRKRGK